MSLNYHGWQTGVTVAALYVFRMILVSINVAIAFLAKKKEVVMRLIIIPFRGVLLLTVWIGLLMSGYGVWWEVK